MYIKAQGYTIDTDENEIWVIVFALRRDVIESVEHYSMHGGLMSLLENEKNKTVLLKQLCNAIGRNDVYDDTIEVANKKFSEIEAAKSKS